jgi:hypothetical protein
MTGEMHTIILRLALQSLFSKSDKKLKEFEPWLTKKHVRWVLENPIWPDPEREKACEIIKLAAALIEARPQ